ncbi:M23 family metallopeptidase [Thermomonas sp.]|uniref:M23 family metallopeptidase n=1 Tax=Thermomonas sp. TaxID=1971895 RepID=UPI002C7899BF|nr:M23 family metallopeptidase [Thermomonas sp.]HRO63992.1 M23 family metallopeptidase [Thermomonas sp.]
MSARWLLALLFAIAGAGAQQAVSASGPAPTRQASPVIGVDALPARETRLPTSVPQGSMVLGKTDPAARVEYAGRTLKVTPYGSFVFGIGRDVSGTVKVRIKPPAGDWIEHSIRITPRDWPIEAVRGVPPATVNPPKAIAERIAREQAAVAATRTRDGDELGFAQIFIRPVEGRISGRFGRARSYNGQPGAPHSGMDIAAASGTPVKAPASGVVIFAAPDLYLTGGTLVIDHGHGISSTFLHLSRIDVQVGDAVRQGDAVAAVGATGRATGPHLHWGMNWFDVRIDPQLVLERK